MQGESKGRVQGVDFDSPTSAPSPPPVNAFRQPSAARKNDPFHPLSTAARRQTIDI